MDVVLRNAFGISSGEQTCGLLRFGVSSGEQTCGLLRVAYNLSKEEVRGGSFS